MRGEPSISMRRRGFTIWVLLTFSHSNRYAYFSKSIRGGCVKDWNRLGKQTFRGNKSEPVAADRATRPRLREENARPLRRPIFTTCSTLVWHQRKCRANNPGLTVPYGGRSPDCDSVPCGRSGGDPDCSLAQIPDNLKSDGKKPSPGQ